MEKEKYIKIPDEFLGAFTALQDLSEDDFDFVLKSIQELNVGENVNFLGNILKQKIKNGDFLAKVIFSFLPLLNELKANDLSENFLSAFLFQTGKSKSTNNVQKVKIKDRFLKLFESCTLVRITEKSLRLLNTDSNVCEDVSIVTELRPVRPIPGLTDENKRYIYVYHKLVIKTFDANGEKSVFSCVLDNFDIETLRVQLSNAFEEREHILKSKGHDYIYFDFVR